MANVQHAALTGANLHEPKGCETAALGEAYIANGAGSGTWEPVQIAEYACLRATATAATTLMSTAYQAINATTLGGDVTWTQNVASGVTSNTTSGYLTVPDTGTYQLIASLIYTPSTASSVWSFTIGVDSGSGIVSKEASILAKSKTTSTSDTSQTTLVCIPSLLASDKVYLMVKEDGGKELLFDWINFTLTRVNT